MQPHPARAANSGLWLGVILIGLGLLLLLAIILPQTFVSNLTQLGWPLLIVIPGLALVVLGMTVRGLSALCVPGSIVTIFVLVLGIQNAFDLYAYVAYASALL